MPNTQSGNWKADCPLCHPQTETIIWQGGIWRVVLVDDVRFPGYTRLIHNEHVREMTDLPAEQRTQCMDMICRIETAMRRVLEPDKINWAQFGNMAPHLHWHIIPRWQNDSHFPESIWGPTAARSPGRHKQWTETAEQLRDRLDDYQQTLKATLP